MSFLTRCPICQTVFRVEARTLAASDGEAKCGVCGMVFTAIDQHLPEISNPVAPAPAHLTETDPVTLSDLDDLDLVLNSAFSVPDTAAAPCNDPSPLSTSGDEAVDTALAVTASDSTPFENPVLPDDLSSESLTSHGDDASVLAEPEPGLTDQQSAAVTIPAVEPHVPVHPEIVPLADESTNPLLLTRPAASTKNRLPSVLLLCVLSLSLSGQLAWIYRYTMLNESPMLLSLANRVCPHASCLLTDASRNISYLRLVSTDLEMIPNHPHLLHVHFSLQSDASIPIPTPGVSLVLTDAQDNLLVQRNFSPKQYLTKAIRVLPNGVEVPGDLYLNIGDLSVSNFRLLLIPA